MQLDLEIAFKIFSWGVDYGQLTMEKERENEDWADAFNGYLVSRKTAMPANPTPKRQPHSEEWFKAKRKSFDEFQDLLVQVAQKN